MLGKNNLFIRFILIYSIQFHAIGWPRGSVIIIIQRENISEIIQSAQNECTFCIYIFSLVDPNSFDGHYFHACLVYMHVHFFRIKVCDTDLA